MKPTVAGQGRRTTVPGPECRVPSVVLLGTLDSKGQEYSFLARLIREHGCEPVLVDAGVFGPTANEPAAVGNEHVARLGGADLSELAASGDRGRAVTAMGVGAAVAVRELYEAGRLDAVLAAGGSGGTSIASTAMRGLPLGVPKLIVSTVASGDVRRYVGGSDIAMIPSVVDVSGVNRLSELVFRNAAAAICAMAAGRRRGERPERRPCVGATMFGVTTPCVTAAAAVLDEAGYEVLTFHANGAGGQAFEAVIAQGLVCGAIDAATTEFADAVAGGELPACTERLETAGALGLPQVVSVGAVDVVNFGPPETVPRRFRDRTLVRHNPHVTLMRTSAEECGQIARALAAKLNRAAGPVSLFLPLQGFSALSGPGGPFHDPVADRVLREELTASLSEDIHVVQLDMNINEPAFGRQMAQQLIRGLDAAAKSEVNQWIAK
jgi:uncharacterized protein (UPF0261 family)